MKSSLCLVLASFGLIACSSESSTAPATCPGQTSTAADPPATGGDSTAIDEVKSFGDNPGGLKMYVHEPAGKTPFAVVVALHGCTQSAADYVNAGWNDVADREGLVVVYAEQSTVNNPMRCFRWWEPDHIGKSGEAKSIANMVAAAHSKYGTTRAFVTGLSAGGAMTAVMLAAYPELFEAGAIMAGVPYKCATSQADSFGCLGGKTQTADAWGALVPAASTKPRVSIWQGDADFTVRPENREELVKQWTKVNGVSEEPSETTAEGAATHHVHRDASGTVRVESWEIAKMGHGVAVDPKADCGKAGAFVLDAGVCSTGHAAAFFLGTTSQGTRESDGGTAAPDPCR